MRDAALGLLGLGARNRGLVIGTAAVRAALQQSDLALVVVASDASQRTDEKVIRLARATGVPVVTGPPASVLAGRIGQRSTVQAVGVRDRHLAVGIRGSLMRQEES